MMDPKKPRGKAQSLRQSNLPDGFDASPDLSKNNGDRDVNRSNRNGQKPKFMQEMVSGARSMWSQYLAILKQSFVKLDRRRQELFIMRLSQAVTIGSAVVTTGFFYPLLPTIIRVVALPAILLTSWWCGTNIVAPQMVIRLSKYLNND